ncbi:MAG TPA: hypothetical protein VLX61_01485 [Anaerolineales bacterium]|nr:hypothetical protein [Anaerolineales bacterium]
MNKPEETKTTNEKPISLYPLDFKEVLSATLKIKPSPKEKKPKKQNSQKTSN